MNRPFDAMSRVLCACGLAALLAGGATPAAAAVHLAVQPAAVNVSPGAEFDLTLEITPAGSAFNSFTAIVSYDPAALTFVPRVPASAQQGCLMTGLCSSVCGATFHLFSAAGDSLAITDGLLCDTTSIVGPGTVYKLRFRASNTAQDTWVRIRRTTFVDAGIYVTPVIPVDAHIGIGVALDAGPAVPAVGFSVRAEPNPSRGPVMFALESDRAGAVQLEVHDLAGRLVRRFAADAGGAGVSRIRWDGFGANGERVRPGVYLVTARSGGRVARARVAVID